MPHLLYLIGEPGVGKTTLLEALTCNRRRRALKKPFFCTEYEDGLLQLGGHRPNGFGGTDALSMSVQPKVIELLKSGRWPRIVAEGDRLANVKFFDAARQAGYQVDVALLEAPEDVLEWRRAWRGSEQNETWLKGRRSKVQNLRSSATILLDATKPTAELVQQLQHHPVFTED